MQHYEKDWKLILIYWKLKLIVIPTNTECSLKKLSINIQPIDSSVFSQVYFILP